MDNEIHDGPSSDEVQNESSQLAQPELPKINCQEKIKLNHLNNEKREGNTAINNQCVILCVDLSCEVNTLSLQSGANHSFPQLQKALDFLVKCKLGLNKSHMFALVTLEDTAHWLQDFSYDMPFICDTLNQLSCSSTEMFQTFGFAIVLVAILVIGLSEQILDMSSLFEVIENHVELPKVDDIELPPPYVVRVVILYGRSHSDIADLSPEGKLLFDKFMSSPYFFLDVLYVHAVPSEHNKCEATYDAFCKLDDKEVCFMLEVSQSSTRLIDNAAKLLAHPLQRPRQQDLEYEFTQFSSFSAGKPD